MVGGPLDMQPQQHVMHIAFEYLCYVLPIGIKITAMRHLCYLQVISINDAAGKYLRYMNAIELLRYTHVIHYIDHAAIEHLRYVQAVYIQNVAIKYVWNIAATIETSASAYTAVLPIQHVANEADAALVRISVLHMR